jgi:2-keto-4-pentenoate hydratase/2-oxohepta-3-ene-1,7-dioic acid hydratase in catechol pathway
MKFVTFSINSTEGIGVLDEAGALHGLLTTDALFPGDLDTLIRAPEGALAAAGAVLAAAPAIDAASFTYLPPFRRAGKVICIGLNYIEHNLENNIAPVTYPGVFVRFNSNLIGHGAPIIRPKISEQLDYEGEMVAVIGKGGRGIAKEEALSHIAGYSIFNDGSIRDYQMKSGSRQWTVGKNFDNTGVFGPAFVTADEVPPGGAGLHLETRLNGVVVQSANTSELMVDVEALVVLLSEAFTLLPGDVIVTGTPSGVGLARKPPLWMKPGDTVQVEIEKLGKLVNPIIDEV